MHNTISIFDNELRNAFLKRAKNTAYKTPEIVELLQESITERLSYIGSKFNKIEINGIIDFDFQNFIDQSASQNVFISVLELQFINDVPGFLIDVKSRMNPGDIFLCFFLGGSTFKELRERLEQLDLEVLGGISPKVAPMIAIKDAGMLAQKSGFKKVVADSEIVQIEYECLKAIQKDIASLGIGNCLFSRSKSYLGKNYLTQLKQSLDAKPITLDFELISLQASLAL
jgi:hypothetical protein